MPDSIREQVITEIVAAFNAEYSLGDAFDDDQLPITVIADDPETASSEVHGRTDCEVPVNVASGVKVRTSDPDELRKTCNGLLAAIQQVMVTLADASTLIDSAQYTGGAILPEPGNRCIAEAVYTVRYHWGETPFTQD